MILAFGQTTVFFSCKANLCDNLWSGHHPHSPTTHRIHIIWPFAFSVIYMNGWKSSGEWCYHCVWTISKAHVLYKVNFLMTMFTLSISGRRLVVYPVSVETRLSWSEFKVLHIGNFSEIIIFFFFIFSYILSLPGLSACYWI